VAAVGKVQLVAQGGHPHVSEIVQWVYQYVFIGKCFFKNQEIGIVAFVGFDNVSDVLAFGHIFHLVELTSGAGHDVLVRDQFG
jgi:hypothetical protein